MRPVQALRACLAMALLCVAQVSRADPSFDAYVTEVLARQPSLQAQSLRRGALVHESNAAALGPDPVLTVMGDRLPGTATGAEMPMVRYQVAQMFMWPGKLPLMRDAIRAEADLAGANLDVKRQDLALEARRAYLMLVLNGKRREINRASRGLAATIAAAALGRYASQAGGHHEVVRAEVEVRALDVQHEALVGERSSMIAMMNALRFQPGETPITEPTVFAWAETRTFAIDALVAAAARQRPELREMAAMQEGMARMERLARKAPYPDLMAGAWFNQMLMGAPSSFGVMLGGNIPVWGLERASLRGDAYRDRADAVLRDASSMRAMIASQVVSAHVRFETAGRVAELLETIAIPRAREGLSASLSGYSTGSVELVGVLESRRALQVAELSLAEARVERELSLALLERAAGGPLPRVAP